jgi:DNA-directed RNA polymerase subunit RPC12/RpoP
MRHGSDSTLTLDQAYQAAYLWMFHVGEPPVDITERRAQSVELRSEGMAAFVRVPDRPLNQRTVLAVLATESDDRARLIFSSRGFTPGAISIAEAQGIALFSFDSEGTALPENRRAARVAPREGPPPPFPAQQAEEELTLSQESGESTGFADGEWIDCPGCGTNQHHTLDICTICGASLAKADAPGEAREDIVFRCSDCGSHNVVAVPTRDTALRV